MQHSRRAWFSTGVLGPGPPNQRHPRAPAQVWAPAPMSRVSESSTGSLMSESCPGSLWVCFAWASESTGSVPRHPPVKALQVFRPPSLNGTQSQRACKHPKGIPIHASPACFPGIAHLPQTTAPFSAPNCEVAPVAALLRTRRISYIKQTEVGKPRPW